jgi:UDP-N-acetylmuramoyl-tripeptide--D-alanyl-D-alanine ligase
MSFVDGILLGDDCAFSDVQIDSRECGPGSLFVAIKGENLDGHNFISDATNRGAVAVIAEHDIKGAGIKVADSLIAYGQVARFHLQSLQATCIGITGSSGKTSTKDLLAQVLQNFGQTIAPPGSFNNEIGLPSTVLSATSETDFLVLEMGMRGLGHISYLCEIAQPKIGVLLNVGSAHIELLGSRENIARAKSEIVQSLPLDGTAILFADDELVHSIGDTLACRVITFGESNRAHVRLSEIELDERARPHFTLTYQGEEAHVALQLTGEHQAFNAAAVAATCLALGFSLRDIAPHLSTAQPHSKWRMEVVELHDGITLINDAYNANPESMRAGLKSLKALAQGRRTWAVLGEMRELGDHSLAAHDEMGRLCVRLDISKVIAVGQAGRIIHLGASQEGSWGDESHWVESPEEATQFLLNNVQAGDVIYIKASRAIGLERVAQELISALDGENTQP